MRVDSHQHYWKIERGDYGWLKPESGILYRDYMPEDLKPFLQKNAFDKTIVVQAAPTVSETEFLLSLCEQEETLAGVVGWLDLEADHFPQELKRFSENPYFLGVRPMIQDILDSNWILRPKVVQALHILAEQDVPLDLLVLPKHLPNLIQVLEKVPNLRAVVDHLAKPFIKNGILDPWREQIARIAEYEQIFCKLSGMVTEADLENWKTDDLIPYVHHVVRVFGTRRVMFGSDWPVCLLAASFSGVVKALSDALPQDVTPEEFDNIFGGNAIYFYRPVL